MAKTTDRSPKAKATRARETRARLIDAARRLFGEKGYASTSIDEVVRAAGVTKGALYHHFTDKDDLFRAVVEEVKADVTSVAGASFLDISRGDDPFERLHMSCMAMIDAHLDPAVQRITVLDARAVFDAATRRDLDTRYEVSLMRGALRSAMRAGAVERQELGALAAIVVSAIFEGCALIGEAADPVAARLEVSDVLRQLLAGLQAPVAVA